MMRAIRAERARREAEAERERVSKDEVLIRQRCETLYGFIQEFWSVLEPSKPFVGGWAIMAMCDHLEAVTRGDIQYLLITVPPGMMKSLLVAVFWPAWEWTFPHLTSMRYLTTSYSEANVLRDNQKMRRVLESEKYQALWGSEIKFTRDQNAKGKFENTKTGAREGRAFGSMTGGRGDRVIIDDPHSVDTAESDVQRQATVTTFREAIPDRLNDMQKSAIVVIMQRLNEGDVAGTILSLKLPYVHLNLPMEFEPERACSTPIGFSDPRTIEGELLFPERFPRAEIEGLKVSKGSYAYAGQYQQRPAPRSGGMFQRGDFEVVDVIPANAKCVRAWDFAASKEKVGRQPDWTVGLRMAYISGIFYVENVDRGRWSPNEVNIKLKNHASQDGTRTTIRIPQDPGAAGKADADTKVKLLAGYDVRVVSPTGDKATRAKPASAQAEAGNVKLVRGDWNTAFLDEICTFPSGHFDDQVDAFADALNELALGGNGPGMALYELMRQQAEAKAAEPKPEPPKPELAPGSIEHAKAALGG